MRTPAAVPAVDVVGLPAAIGLRRWLGFHSSEVYWNIVE